MTSGLPPSAVHRSAEVPAALAVEEGQVVDDVVADEG
jgi:hypothetical protein